MVTATPTASATALPRRPAEPGTGSTPWSNRLLALLAALRPPDGWLSSMFLAFNLVIVVWSVEVADWAPTPSLVGTMLLSLLTALVLSRIRFWAAFLLPLGILIGIGVIIWFMTAAAPAALKIETSGQLFERLGMWLFAARNDGISVDPLPFAVGMMIAAWVSGFLGGWVFFRYRTFWGVFALGTVGLLSNLTFLPENASVYLAMYLFTGLLLVGWVQSVRARQRWDREGRIYDGHLGILTMSDTALVALVALLIAFLLPIGGQWGPANAFYSVTRTPLVTWEEDFNRLFAGLPARRPLPYRIWGDAMAFQGTINPTDTPVLQVNSPVPMYWKARSYATYTHEGWISEGTVLQEPGWQPEYSAPSPEQKRFNVTFEVVPKYNSRSVFAGGQVIGSNRDIRIETFDSPKYVIDPHVGGSTDNLPTTLAETVEGVRAAVSETSDASNQAIAASLPTSFLLESVERDQDGAVLRAEVAETVPAQPDVLSVRTSRGVAESGAPYQVTTAVSNATPDDLRTAGDEYAPWVWTRYTQLPPDTPYRIGELARQVTANAESPYDKAKAVERYLKTNYAYNLAIEPPPFGSDGVDHFLFESREGYSEYFGSAMTVLMRSIGIPARMATGYTVGSRVPDSELYVVADHHSHGWSEVYFNGYGWIPFEPTPGKSIPIPIPPEEAANRDGANLSSSADDEFICEIEEECEDFDQLLGDDALPLADLDGPVWLFNLRNALPWASGFGGAALILAAAAWTGWRWMLATPKDVRTAYRRLQRLSRVASLGPRPHQTPHQWGANITAVIPEQRQAVVAIVDAYARHIYAGRDGTASDRGEHLGPAWASLRGPLALYALRRRES
jgi:transglutaminase-like putative cysteine protease